MHRWIINRESEIHTYYRIIVMHIMVIAQSQYFTEESLQVGQTPACMNFKVFELKNLLFLVKILINNCCFLIIMNPCWAPHLQMSPKTTVSTKRQQKMTTTDAQFTVLLGQYCTTACAQAFFSIYYPSCLPTTYTHNLFKRLAWNAAYGGNPKPFTFKFKETEPA